MGAKKSISVSIVFWMAFVVGIYAQDQVSFQLQAPRSVRPGERFEVVYSLKNAVGRNFKTAKFKGCRVLSGPALHQSSRLSLSGGYMGRLPYENRAYLLQANRKGSVVIPASSLTVQGKKYKTLRTVVAILPDASARSAADVRFTVSLPDNIRSGETFQVVYRLSGGEGTGFTVGKFKNGKVISGPSVRSGASFYFQQGAVTTYTYTVQAGEAGRIVIPEARVRIGNKKYKTDKTERTILPLNEKERSRRFQDAAAKYPTI
ncbi:MAG: BatD family protein [Coprobacter sp.]|nr:BatD family protein [Coprobacter sp.]